MNTEFDLSYIRDLVQDEDMVLDLIKTFHDQGPKDYDLLMGAISEKDHTNSRVYAHKLKSSLGIFKVEGLRSEFEKLEKRCIQKEDIQIIEAHAKEVKTPLMSLIKTMGTYL